MTMRDLIRYLPLSNPMTSSLEDSAQENTTVVPPSPGREESPERAREPEDLPTAVSPREEADEEEEEALMVPQVKVAEDGSLIIDEESLTVEVQRSKGPNPMQDRDPIFERGSTTTYSSFRKGICSKPWSSEETDMFFLAVSMVGTDFSMICQLFPHRSRAEIKHKFKKEERVNSWRIDKAFRERRKLDIEYFSKLLEKIMEVQKNRKKLRSLAKKKPCKDKRKAKGRKATRKLSDVEEEDEDDENQVPDLEDKEEKENEDLCNDGESPASEPKRRRKRKAGQDASNNEPDENENKTGGKSSEQAEACIPEDTEAALPVDATNSEMSEKGENVNAAKNTTVKPAKLSRARAPKQPLPPASKRSKKAPSPSTKATDNGDDSENKDASPLRQASKRKSASQDVSSEEEDATVQPPRPTRYGRVPKPTKPLTYPSGEDAHSSASESHPASSARNKRRKLLKPQSAQESRKPTLVTLRASQSDYSDEENEQQQEEEEEEEEQHLPCSPSKDSIAPVFVPASLRSPRPVVSEVIETVEELVILTSMPDVLGISQDALCPDASCEQAQNETGTAEPCEHQLDLLVDVIDFLSSEHAEVSDVESYNEAAQTLLTISNLPHVSQAAQNQIFIQDHVTGTASVSVNETSQHLEAESASSVSTASIHGVTETSENEATMVLQHSTADSGEIPIIKTTDQVCNEQRTQMQSSPESSKKDSPQTSTGHLSMVKPTPDLGQPSRTAQPKSQPQSSDVWSTEESPTVAPNLSQVPESLSAPEETTSEIPESTPGLLKNGISCIEVKLTEEPSGSEEKSVGQRESDVPASDLSASENQSRHFLNREFDPSLENVTREAGSTDEKLMSPVDIIKSDSNNPAASDTSVTEADSVSVQDKTSHHSAAFVTPVENVPVSQKAESEVASTCQSRRSRFQKVKPKLNLTSRTARSKPPTKKEVEQEQTHVPSHEKPSHSAGPVSGLIQLGSALTPTEGLSTNQEKRTDVEIVAQVDSGAAASGQGASENQNFYEASFQPNREQAGRKAMPSSESTERSCHKPVTSRSAITELQIGQGSNVDLSPILEGSGHPVVCVTPVEELPVGKKEESEVTAACQSVENLSSSISMPESTDNPIAKTEPQPACHTFQPEKPSQGTGTASVSVPSFELSTTHKSTEEQKTDVRLDSSSESSEPNVPQRRRRFPKIKPKPNLGSSARTAQSKLQPKDTHKPSEHHHEATSSNVTSQHQSEDNNRAQAELEATEKDSRCLTSACCSLNTELLSSTKSSAAESEMSLDSKNGKGTSSDGIVIATSWLSEHQSMLTDSVPENKNSEKSTVGHESTRDKMPSKNNVEAGSSSQGYCKLDTRVTGSNSQATAVSNVHSSEDGSTESQINSVLTANVYSLQDPKESSHQSCSENHSEVKGQDAATSEPKPGSNVKSQSAQSTDDTKPEPADSSTSSRRTPQVRRGRLIKPKPNLGHSAQPPRPQQVKKKTQTEADSDTCSQRVEATVSHKPVSELRADIQEPVQGAVEQLGNQGSSLGCLTHVTEHDSPSNHAGSSLGCMTQVPSTQNTSTSSLESYPNLTIFPDVLSEQVPSDPDEPFFILSLTEIPVCSSGEVQDSTAEPLPYPSVTHAPVQQQSTVPGESLAAAGHRSLSDVSVPTSMQESDEMSCISIKHIGPEPATYIGSTTKNPVDACEGTTVQSPKFPETRENTKAEPPPAKQRITGTGRRAKLQVKPNTARRKQSGSTTQGSEDLGPSVQPETCGATAGKEVITEPHKGSVDHTDIEKDILTGGKGPEDSSTGVQSQTAKTRVASCQKSTASSSDRPPGKAVSKSPKVKTPHAGKRSTTSSHVAPTPKPPQLPHKTHSASAVTPPTKTEVDIELITDHSRPRSDATPSTSQCTVEVSASQQSDSVESSSIEEPTSVSQYFLSDIFTEVEEG
uniref:Myb-like domain-containing protein n=1 Tax=Monopterus albus TaxID=43700 RepID=A0A3Q3JT77_MONAL